MDYFQIIGIPKNANKDDLKRAFRQKAKTDHPDMGGTPERFRLLIVAYQELLKIVPEQTKIEPQSFNTSFGAPSSHKVFNACWDYQLGRYVCTLYLDEIQRSEAIFVNVSYAQGANSGKSTFLVRVPAGIKHDSYFQVKEKKNLFLFNVWFD